MSRNGSSTLRGHHTFLGDRDFDAHTPLLIEVHANQFTGGRMRAMNGNPDTVKEAGETEGEQGTWVQ